MEYTLCSPFRANAHNSSFVMTLMCGHKCLVRISDRYLHYYFAEIKNVNEKRPILYTGTGATNVCTNIEINRYKINQFRKHAKIVCFIRRHVLNAKTVRRTSWGLWYLFRSGTFWNQPEVSTTSESKVLAQTVFFHDCGDLDFDLCSIFFHTH